MFKRLIVIFVCLAGVCFAVFAQGSKKNFNAEDAKDAKGTEVAVFPQLGHSENIRTVAFSPDGTKILSNSPDGNIKLWDIESGRELKTIEGHILGILSLNFNLDGRFIFSYLSEKIIRFLDIESGQEIRPSINITEGINNICFSPDLKFYLTNTRATKKSSSDILKLWDVEGEQVIRTFTVHAFTGYIGKIGSAGFSPDGTKIIAISRQQNFLDPESYFDLSDFTINIWDIESGELLYNLTEHVNVGNVRFSHDGKQIISSSRDGNIKIWDLESGEGIRTFIENVGWIDTVNFSPDDKQFVSLSDYPDNILKLYDVESGRVLRSFSRYRVNSFCFSPDSTQILAGLDGGVLVIWDTDSGREIRTFTRNTDIVSSVSFSPDREQIISGSYDGSIKLWDAVSGREIRNFSGHTGGVDSVCFNNDGTQVLSGSLDGTIKLWDTDSGNDIRTFTGHTGIVRAVCFNSDETQILSCAFDSTIKLWEKENSKMVRTIKPDFRANYSVCFSPDGIYFISGSVDGSPAVKLWETASGEEIRAFTRKNNINYPVYSVCFSPDGNQALSGFMNGLIIHWDVETGEEIQAFSGHQSLVLSVCFSSDGKQVLSGSKDKTIKLWDVESGQEIKTFIGHTGAVNSAIFIDNDTRILSGSADGTTRLWDVATGKEIASFISFSGTDSQLTAASRDITFEVAEAASDISGEWIVITPDGYYAASPQGDRYLNVRVGNKVTGVDSFRHIFYNPDVVRARLQGLPDPDTKKTVTIQDVLSFFPSAITLRVSGQRTAGSGQEVLSAFSTTTTGTINLAVNIIDDNQPIQSVKIFVNGNLVGQDELKKAIVASDSSAKQSNLKIEKASITVTGNQKTLSFNIPLTLDPGENLIEVVSFNGYAESRRNTRVTWQTAAGFNPELPNLWLLAVGVNQYNDASIKSLNYCANDAREIINSFKAQEGKRYAKVNTRLIADGTNIEPTAKNIRDNLKFLDDARPRDIILLFLAGHGVNGKDGAFQFLPRDAVRNKDDTMSNVITGDEIAKVLETPGKRLIFIDACHSGGIDNDRMLRQLMNTNAYVFASSKGNEFSLELAELKHGVFTYSIMDTMRSQQARAGKNLSVIGLSGNVRLDVPRRTNNRQNPVGYSLGFYDFVLVE